MTAFTITNSSFMLGSVGETNDWMSKNIGTLRHDTYDYTYGDGWDIRYTDNEWIVTFDDPEKAVLFALRWL